MLWVTWLCRELGRWRVQIDFASLPGPTGRNVWEKIKIFEICTFNTVTIQILYYYGFQMVEIRILLVSENQWESEIPTRSNFKWLKRLVSKWSRLWMWPKIRKPDHLKSRNLWCQFSSYVEYETGNIHLYPSSCVSLIQELSVMINLPYVLTL